MKDFDAVVFDMDGVIFDSERATMECWLALAGKYGMRKLEIIYLDCIGCNAARTDRILQDAYGDDFPYEAFKKEASRAYHEKYDGGRLPLKSGVREILGLLRKNSKKVALASSTGKQTVFNQLDDAGISAYFDEVITGDMVTASKPEPDIFLLACKKLGVAPEKAYAIEDSYNGIRAASRGNLRPIMVPDLLPVNDEMMELSEAVFENMEETAAYLMG